jgi:hypothetical protein
MQCTSYFSSASEQTLLSLQVREAELRVAREELAFLQACGGFGDEDVRRLRVGLGLSAGSTQHDDTIIVLDDDDDVVVVKEEGGDLVSLRSILVQLLPPGASIAQLCRRVRPVLEREGVELCKRRKTIHVWSGDAEKVLAIGRRVG